MDIQIFTVNQSVQNTDLVDFHKAVNDEVFMSKFKETIKTRYQQILNTYFKDEQFFIDELEVEESGLYMEVYLNILHPDIELEMMLNIGYLSTEWAIYTTEDQNLVEQLVQYTPVDDILSNLTKEKDECLL